MRHRMDDPDVWECIDDPMIPHIGCITTLVEYEKPIRMRRTKGPRVRLGFHPPERAYVVGAD